MIAKPGRWWITLSGAWVILCLLAALAAASDPLSETPFWKWGASLVLSAAIPPAFALWVKTVRQLFRRSQ